MEIQIAIWSPDETQYTAQSSVRSWQTLHIQIDLIKLYYRLRARRARSDIYLYLYLCVLRVDRGCRDGKATRGSSYGLGWLGTAPRVGQSFPAERLGISLTRRLPTPPDRPSCHYWPGAPSFFKHPSSPEQIQDHQIASSAQTMAKIGGGPGDS